MTTNYRKFYEKDWRFHLTVLETEEETPAGHEFKLQLFKDTEF